MIVMKFGGTSVESCEAIHRVAHIVQREHARRPIVVVSAMGKTTNLLLGAAQEASGGRRNKPWPSSTTCARNISLKGCPRGPCWRNSTGISAVISNGWTNS